MSNASKTTCRRMAEKFLQKANQVLQRYARNLRARALNCVAAVSDL